MARPVTLYTLQWGDLSLETVCQKAKEFGYDGVELGLPDHVDVRRTDTAYYQGIKDLLKKYDLRLYAISTHLVGQAVCDNIDERHKAILPDYIWGDGDPEGVHQRATEEMIRTAHTGSAAPASGGRSRNHRPCRAEPHLPGLLHAGGRHESLSLRLLRGPRSRMHLPSGYPAPLSQPAVRSVAGPYRCPRRGACRAL